MKVGGCEIYVGSYFREPGRADLCRTNAAENVISFIETRSKVCVLALPIGLQIELTPSF